MYFHDGTIAAVATAAGRAGIGIIKMSGEAALTIAKRIFRPSIGQTEEPEAEFRPHSHRLYYGHIVEPGSGRKVDEVLVAYMQAPKTYTREDVVEINAHGGAVALQAILELTLHNGARLAEPGEFTLRAFLNGRIDLTQAEGVMDVVNARTERALSAAAKLVSGEMKERIRAVRDAVDEVAAEIEADIDFAEETDVNVSRGSAARRIEKEVCGPLEELLSGYRSARILREGVRMVIIGRPNVGKSSLLNRLLEQERAIVTELPGTTRDAIEATLDINGIPVRIADTAGLHQSEDPVEVIGMRKAEEHIQRSDVVLFMVEGQKELEVADMRIYEKYQAKRPIIVINKMDLVGENGRARIPQAWGGPQIAISALRGDGMEALKQTIAVAVIDEKGSAEEDSLMLNLRQRVTLEGALKAARDAGDGLRSGAPMELVAMDVKLTGQHLGQITGEHEDADLLERIFSNFCVGK